MRSYICVPITESVGERCLAALREADGVADAIEVRLDYLAEGELPGVLAWLGEHGAAVEAALILTFRPREQGGRREVTLAERQAFWQGVGVEVLAAASWVDLEWDLVESWADEGCPVAWEKVICSWHDFAGTPVDLDERYDRMAATPAAVVKMATMVGRVEECARIFGVIEQARGRKPVIALGMGLAGLSTRVLSLSRGALLTFGSLRRGAESAAGQPTIDELRDLYRAKRLSPETEVYGVIGNPVGHSRSPRIHNRALGVLGRDGVYLPFPVEEIGRFVEEMVRPATRRIDWRLRGLSVTIPHKMAIMPFLDQIDETARKIGAVNTVVVEGAALHGYNTDVSGAMRPLEALVDLKGARVAVIGAGGSARAICYGLQLRGAVVTLHARDVAKARVLAKEFGAAVAPLSDFAGNVEVVINCTPVGMQGHSEGESPLPAESLRGVGLVYDLVYTPEETRLLREARAAGCRTLGGLEMLIGQAAEQFRLWTGQEAPLEAMREAARDWVAVPCRVVAGHQVASRASAVYPRGTIEMQTPFFRARGLDLSGYRSATINLDLGSRQFRLRRPAFHFPRVEWTDLHPPEDFSFCRCRLTTRGRTVEGWVYYPHPETKVRHHQERSILEVIAPPIEGLDYGDEVTLELRPEEIELS
ncbi:MAG: shikimate dehydrogenase [Blastocatellia bacterium]